MSTTRPTPQARPRRLGGWATTRLGLHSPLARRLVIGLVLVSSALALLITALQLYSDLRHETRAIHAELLQIEKSFGGSLRRSVWTLDERQIKAQLDGILALPHVEAAFIEVDGRVRWQRGRRPAEIRLGPGSRRLSHRFELVMRYKGRERHIGTVVIVASLEPVYRHLMGKAAFVLLGNGLKTLVVVGVVFLLFQLTVTRRLDALARHARALELGAAPPPLPPARPADDPRADEIDQLSHALHDMQARLTEAYQRLAGLNQELRRESERHRAACRDLSSLSERLEDEVKQRTRALQASNRELESFAYAVSHDLRAPLRSIDGFSLALQEDHAEQLDAEGMQYLQRVRDAAQRMGRLIEDLLQLSRISQSQLHSRHVDLSAIARDIVEHLRQGEPGRRVSVSIQPGLQAWGDPGLLRIALENLLGNAWKYTAGQDRAEIEFGCQVQDRQQVCHVRDNGAGFDMRYADKLFVPFQRLHQAGEFPGEGIGLATVARIINRHGGTLWAEAEPGRGATFYFTLPAAPRSAGQPSED